MTWGLAIALILMAITTRFLPHYPNFTAVGAMGLFGGAYFTKQRWAFLIPFITLFVSDLILNNFVYEYTFNIYALFTYIGFGLVVLAGKSILTKVNAKNVIVASLSASIIFFLVSNLMSWYDNILYTKDLAGLMQCYIAGIPFLGSTVAGDLTYSAVLFGIYEWAKNRQVKLA